MRPIVAGIALAMTANIVSAREMPPLAQKNNCAVCHAIDHRVVGPSWMEVSKRYKDAKAYMYSFNGSAAPDAKEYPLVEGLMHKISHGGNGNWGEAPMIANDPNETNQGEIRQLVEYILGLARQPMKPAGSRPSN